MLAVVLGVLMLVWPGKTLLVAAILFGAYLLISGIAQVFFAFSLHVSAGGRILLFISGAASLILAVLAFRHFGEGYAVLLLAIWIARRFHLPGRGDRRFPRSAIRRCRAAAGRSSSASSACIAGIVMLAWPGLSLLSLLTVVGVWLIVIGVFEIVSAFVIRKATKALTS